MSSSTPIACAWCGRPFDDVGREAFSPMAAGIPFFTSDEHYCVEARPVQSVNKTHVVCGCYIQALEGKLREIHARESTSRPGEGN